MAATAQELIDQWTDGHGVTEDAGAGGRERERARTRTQAEYLGDSD